MKLKVLDKKGKATKKEFDLNTEIFANESHDSILRQSIHVHMLNKRTGSAWARGRGDVSGTGKKPWGNNKVGRARAGDLISPIFRGGGVSHGPVPMNYGKKMPTKMQKTALYLALTKAVTAQKVYIVESLEFTGKTKEAAEFVKTYSENAKLSTGKIQLLAKVTPEMKRAFNNISNVRLLDVAYLNPYDIVNAQNIIITEESFEQLNGKKAEAKKIEVKKEVEKKGTVKKVSKKTK